ncbi:MAG: DsbA family protein [Bacteroidota bacterium]
MKKEVRILIPIAVVAILLAGANFLFFSTSEAAPEEAEVVLTAAGEECFFDEAKEPFTNYASIVNPLDPYTGSPDAPVTVIEFFDPNCPACKFAWPDMRAAIEQNAERARFVFKPIVLPSFPHSRPQVAALYEAGKQGKFFGMADAQFDQQKPQTGLSLEEMQAIATDIEMDVDAMTEAIEAGTYDAYTQAQRQAAQLAGVTGVPTVLINGKHVATKSADCLTALIEREAGAAQGD